MQLWDGAGIEAIKPGGPAGRHKRLTFTDYLAIYAAVLSTLVFLWNVVQSRPRIKVDLIFGFEGTGDDFKTGVYIVVRNLSSHDVHLADINILYPYAERSLKAALAHLWRFRRWPSQLGWVHSSLSNYSIESGCPVCLESRKSHKVLITEDALEEMLAKASDRKLRACVQDQLWNNVYSRVFKWPAPNKA